MTADFPGFYRNVCNADVILCACDKIQVSFKDCSPKSF